MNGTVVAGIILAFLSSIAGPALIIAGGIVHPGPYMDELQILGMAMVLPAGVGIWLAGKGKPR